jgi:sterol desaturase/sphingolipid hydroxylase (fatty acid hydroxylase superfamily)
MESWLLSHSTLVYWSFLIALSLLVGIWEVFRPRRRHTVSKTHRWLTHGFLTALTDGIIILILPIGAVAVAFAVKNSPYGLLNNTSVPFPVGALLAVLLLDLSQYATHYLRHVIPLLWRFHQAHHSDRDIDFSTGFRFHPGEVLFTQGAYLFAVAVLAPAPIVVACYEIVNVAQSLLSHANVRIPPRVERALELALVTPGFHGIHHSLDAAEQMCNMGVLFSFWDRVFHTHRARSSEGKELRFGLEEVTAAQSIEPLTVLALPFTPRRAARLQSERALQIEIGKAP